MVERKRVSYGYDSSLEASGQAGFYLDCHYSRDSLTLLDLRREYVTKEDFLKAVEEVIPIFENDGVVPGDCGCGGKK